ncbi:22976_t:CDS:2, partial [Gigaspora margarita]
NEPPLVPYRIPIIGHTYDFLNDSKTFLKESCEPFSLYIFGGVVTFAGVDSIPEVLKDTTTALVLKRECKRFMFPLSNIVNQFFSNNLPPRVKQLAREISSKANIKVSRMQKELLFEIEQFFGNCKEPKVFRNIHDTMARIMAKFTINLALGKECAQFEDFVPIFAELANMTLKMKFVPPILSFIHPSLHGYFVSLPLRNAIDRHKNIFIQRCKPIVEERILQRKKLAGLPHIMIADSYTFSNGTTIPRGRDIYLYIKDTNFNNKFYGETSDDFQPKRHITSYSDGKIVHPPTTKLDNSFIVFGGGKHACPGRFYAVNIIKIFLHESILRYNIRTESGKIEPPKIISCFSSSSESGLVFENQRFKIL